MVPSLSLGLFGLGRRGLPLLATGFAILLALGAAVFWLVAETRLYAERTTAVLERRVVISGALSALQDAETGQRGFLLTGDPAYLEPSISGRAAFPGLLERLDRAADQAALADLRAVGMRRLAILDENIALYAEFGVAAAVDRLRAGGGKLAMDAARAALARLDAAEASALATSQADLDSSGRLLQFGSVAAIGGVLLVAVVGLGLARRHAAALAAANEAVQAANAALEERVAERTADLAEANEEVQRFATVVTHDLRAPLVNVMGFASELENSLEPLQALLEAANARHPALVSLAARTALASDIPEALGFIRSSTDRMDRLINAILKLSREGRRVLHPEPVVMDDLITGLAGSLSHQLEAAAATLVLEPGLPDVFSDRLALEQIFGNLLDNAVKYLAPGRPGRITVRGRDRGRFLVYEVADNGRGIEARDLARIFEPFRRAGRLDRPGEGIGLAHVRALTRRLGGSIACDSTPGAGSVFRVTLPRRLAPATLAERATHGPAELEKVS